ncbi:diguanylate cyclase (GGDEF) domain-containing protein [Streptoalloteichus hindustanus]|uniref:Diguanylate cyclase (GGDEF) domain-containing protein n=1 Tax=Streptoalloteichus hindustanus TaxID=2017 RepID=A0A1M5DJZ7_STRHI|nr:diguanylate cyclase (GGDEF) domain-containing protein [Streptoalloteichus hindustanus]
MAAPAGDDVAGGEEEQQVTDAPDLRDNSCPQVVHHDPVGWSEDPALPHHVLQCTDIGFGVTDPLGRLQWANPALAGLLRLPLEQVVGRSLPALLPGVPDGPHEATAVLAPTNGEDGHRWLEIGCSRLGPDGLLYTAVDVTAWRDRELEASQQAQSLHRAQVLGRMGNWEWFIAEDRVVWSDALLEMLGFPPGTELDYASYTTLIHPEDFTVVEDSLQRSLRTGERFTYTHRMLMADRRTERIFECYGEVIADGDGVPVRMLGTAHDITQAYRLHAELLRMAEEDPLTGLPNRRALTRELERQLATGGHGTLLLLDLDNFKDVNDLRGHAVGDRVMRLLASTLREHLAADQMIARLGGDEFAVVLPGASVAEGKEAAENLSTAVAALPVAAAGATTRMTVSVGVAQYSRGDGWEGVLANADLALYASKSAGRNRVTVYESGYYDDTAKRVSVLDRVRAALENGGLALHAMPMVDLRDGRVVGHELLLRLEDGQVPAPGPAEFLPAAERSDLVLEIDRWVLGQAIDALVAHPDPELRFDVNVSGRTLEDPDFACFVLDRLAHAGVTPGRLGLEITETAAVTNLEAAQVLARRLRAAGCRITLDDFGSGFGSFVHLKHLPITGLKIDGEFVRGIDDGHRDAVLVTGMIEIARGLGLSAVAEWVERPSQVEALRRLGVTVAQGFHLGRARPLRTLLVPPNGALSTPTGTQQDR